LPGIAIAMLTRHARRHRAHASALDALGIELDVDRDPLRGLRRGRELLERLAAHDHAGVRARLDGGDLGRLRRRHDDHVVRRRHLHLDLLDEHLEFQLGEQLEQLGQIPITDDQILELHVQRHVALELDQLARQLHEREPIRIGERLLEPRDHRIRLDQLRERSVLREQARRGLVAAALEAGDVVAGVADEREEVRDQLGRHAHLLDHLVARVRLLMERVDHRHAVADQLHDVFVGAIDDDFPALALRLDNERRDDVVGFDAGDRQARPAHAGDDLREVLHLHRELLGSVLAVRFVVGVHRRAEVAAGFAVEHDGHALGLVVLLEAHQHAREHVEGAGRHALGGR
jgi:hypothetical protein